MCDPTSCATGCALGIVTTLWLQKASGAHERPASQETNYALHDYNVFEAGVAKGFEECKAQATACITNLQAQLEESQRQIAHGQQRLQQLQAQNLSLAKGQTAGANRELAEVLRGTEVARRELDRLLKEQAEALAHRAGPSAQEAPAMQTMSPQALARSVEIKQRQEAVQKELDDLTRQCRAHEQVQAQYKAQIEQLTGDVTRLNLTKTNLDLSTDPNKQPEVLATLWRLAIQEIERLRGLVASKPAAKMTGGPSAAAPPAPAPAAKPRGPEAVKAVDKHLLDEICKAPQLRHPNPVNNKRPHEASTWEEQVLKRRAAIDGSKGTSCESSAFGTKK